MAASLGSLVVSLGLDAATFTEGLSKAQFQARKFADSLGTEIRKGAELAGAALGLIGAAAIGAFAAVDQLAKSAGDYQDLADKTGASAEGIASLAVAAGTAGVSMEDVAGSTVKLTKGLVGVNDESKAAGAALAAIGINVSDFKKLDPVAQYEAVGKALAGYADGAGKTAIAVDLFGKAGADQLKVFKALEDQGGRTTILTAEQIAQADDYADKQSRLTAEVKLYAQAAATQALPAINAFTGAVKDTIQEVLGLDKGTAALGVNSGVKDFAESAVKALAFVVDAADGVVRVFEVVGKSLGGLAASTVAAAKLDFKGALAIGNEAAADIDAILNRTTFSEKLRKQLAAANTAGAGSPATNRPALNYSGATTKAKTGTSDDPTKKLLDNDLKTYERYISDEKDLLASRNRFLDLYNGQNLLSIKDYYGGRQAAADEALQAEVAGYDKQIAALQAYQATAKKATDRADAQGKIEDIEAKRAKAIQSASADAVEATLKEQTARDALARSYQNVNAQVLELQGHLSAAAAIRFDQSNQTLTKQFTAEGNQEALTALSTLKDYTLAQAEFNQYSQQMKDSQDALRLVEDRLSISRSTGAISELSYLKQISDARTAAAQQQAGIAASLTGVADKSGLKPLQTQAAQAQLAVEQLASQTDLLGQKFTTIFEDSATDALSGFIDGTLSAKDAFRSFTDSVFQGMSKIVAQNFAENFFGKSGAGGGAGGFFANLLGGSSGGSSGGGITAFLSSLFGRANGGMVEPGGLYRVNERGPEVFSSGGNDYLLNGSRAGRVAANGGGGMSLVINQTFAPGTTRQTTDQAALQASRTLQRAQRNA